MGIKDTQEIGTNPYAFGQICEQAILFAPIDNEPYKILYKRTKPDSPGTGMIDNAVVNQRTRGAKVLAKGEIYDWNSHSLQKYTALRMALEAFETYRRDNGIDEKMRPIVIDAETGKLIKLEDLGM